MGGGRGGLGSPNGRGRRCEQMHQKTCTGISKIACLYGGSPPLPAPPAKTAPEYARRASPLQTLSLASLSVKFLLVEPLQNSAAAAASLRPPRAGEMPLFVGNSARCCSSALSARACGRSCCRFFLPVPLRRSQSSLLSSNSSHARWHQFVCFARTQSL